MQSVYATVASNVKRATVEDIKKVVKKATPYLVDKKKEEVEPNVLEEKKGTVGVTVDSIFKVQDASDVLHGCVDEKELSKERCRDLLHSVEPFIYGKTPLYQSIDKATELFQKTAYRFPSHRKLLFILSDGEPTDGQPTDRARISRAVSKLTTAGVTVVSCFITDNSTQIDPRRLFSTMGPDWIRGAKFLFSLSSKLSTQSLPRTFFVNRRWTIDITNNETHLFLQVNHPDHLREACDVARNVVCCQDALSDLLLSVDLDLYINQEVEDYKAKKKQEGGTCYANAAATVLHLSIRRILGREGEYPDFYKLREEFINRFGFDGANTFLVLQEMRPKYRLHCQKVDLMGAMEAITSSRPVVARFRLTDHEWDSFKTFFKKNRKGILTKKEIDINSPSSQNSSRWPCSCVKKFRQRVFTTAEFLGRRLGGQGIFQSGERRSSWIGIHRCLLGNRRFD